MREATRVVVVTAVALVALHVLRRAMTVERTWRYEQTSDAQRDAQRDAENDDAENDDAQIDPTDAYVTVAAKRRAELAQTIQSAGNSSANSFGKRFKLPTSPTTAPGLMHGTAYIDLKRDGRTGLEPVRRSSDCVRAGRRRGVVAVGHRNSRHPNPAYRNTCFAYTDASIAPMLRAWAKQGGERADRVHTTSIL